MSGNVDLSTVPAPAVVEPLDYGTILSDLLADLVARYPTYSALVESDPAYKVLETAAYRELQLRQRVNDGAKACMLAYSTGTDLDQLAAYFGVTRLTITPADPAHGIAAVMEADADLRRRVLLAPDSFSTAGPTGAYVFHARSAAGAVIDASATSPDAGKVLVSVLADTDDGTPDAATLDAVRNVLNSADVRPLTDQVTVQAATIVAFTVAATIRVYAGPDPDVVLSNARTRLDAYLADSRKLGRDVTTSGLIAALMAPGVQGVTLSAPAADVVVDDTQAAHCTGINLTNGGIDD